MNIVSPITRPEVRGSVFTTTAATQPGLIRVFGTTHRECDLAAAF
jgi:hypothetical protein